ncbi:MAG: 2-C-methyl-D-erythritol 4-phosphate cytidylyltransferase [Gammaproteobacteria bacterium]
MTDTRYWAVIPAAGIGSRFGSGQPKQYVQLLGKTLLEHTLLRFCEHERIHGVVVPLAENDTWWPTLAIARHPKIQTVAGGRERMHSVLNGLSQLQTQANADDWVLVHDAARPCIRMSDISLLIEQLAAHPVGGILGWPVRDTMKRGDAADEITATVDRSGLWHALTPQMFRLQDLQQALEKVNASNTLVTDEAQAMELQGLQPGLVAGAPDNIKVTLAADLVLAELYLRAQQSETNAVNSVF